MAEIEKTEAKVQEKKAAKKPAKDKKPSLFARIGKFFREYKAELKKVTWPTKSQLINNTIVILVFVIIVTVILSVLDLGFGKLFQMLTSIGA